MSEILIICGAGIVSGKEITSLELGEGLRERGREVSFVTSYWNDGDFPERLRRKGLTTYILPIGFISATLTRRCLEMTCEQIRQWPGLLWNYSRLLRRLKPETVIHTNWHHLLLLLPFLRPSRDLFWVHEVIPDLSHYKRVFGWLHRRLSLFVCVSQAVASSLRRIGVPDEKLIVIHSGTRDPAALSSPCFDPHQFRIGVVGQVNPWKGHSDVIEAFALLAPKYPDMELHVFGKGDAAYRLDLCQLAVELGVAQRIVWHGYVADRAIIYRGLDVCVVPSRSAEPLGLAAIEPGFFGLPSIVTRQGGLPEIIEHETNGLLVEAERPREIMQALSRLIREPELRQRLGANARKRAVEYFGLERFLDEFLALLGKTSSVKGKQVMQHMNSDAVRALPQQRESAGK